MQGGRLERTLEMTILIRAINQTTGAFSGVKLAATAAIVAIGAGLAYSVKQAADFQQGLTTLATGAGEAVNKLQQVGDGIKQVSIETGTSTDDLIKSMFLIESANFRGASGLQVLLTAAEGAKVGNTDLTKTTQVLLTMLHDYHEPASQAVADTNSIIATVKNGTMTMDDLNGAMKNVLSIASAFHIKLSDVEGALATMSVAGDKGSAAGTHLAMMLRMLSNPATTAANEMAAMGINSVNLANEMRISLPLALQEIETAVARHFTPGSVEFNRAITTILGGTRSGVAGLELMNANLPIFKANAASAATAAATAGKDVTGWALVQKEFNQQLAEAQAAVNVLAITIGQALLPPLTATLQAIVPLISQFSTWVGNLNLGNSTTFPIFASIMAGLATVLAFAVAPALISAGVAFGAFAVAAAPVLLVAGTVALAAYTIATTVPIWGKWIDWLTGRYSGLEEKLQAVNQLSQIQQNEQTIQQNSKNRSALESQRADLVKQLDQTHSPGMRRLIQQQIDQIDANAQQITQKNIQLQQQALDTQRQMRQTAQGRMLQDEGAYQRGLALEQQNQQEIYALYNHLNKLIKMRDQTHDLVKKKEIQHQIDLTYTQIDGANKQLTAQQQADAKLKTAIDQDHQQILEGEKNFIQRFLDMVGGWLTNLKNMIGNAFSWIGTQIHNALNWFGNVTGGMHLSGVPGHASGILNSPYGHWATVGEHGPEPMYVPKGASIFPNGSFGGGAGIGSIGGGPNITIHVSTLAGSRAEVMRLVDLLETELANRFRSQTNSFSLRGLA